MNEALHEAMLAAHDTQDSAALVRLYTEAADLSNDIDAACFFLTHAYVFALEAGAPEVAALRDRLVAHGREVPAPEDVSDDPDRALSHVRTRVASASGGKTG